MYHQTHQKFLREALQDHDSSTWLAARREFEKSWAQIKDQYGIEAKRFDPQEALFITENRELVGELLSICYQDELDSKNSYDIAECLREVITPYLDQPEELRDEITDLYRTAAGLAASYNRVRDFVRAVPAQILTGSHEEKQLKLSTTTSVLGELHRGGGSLSRQAYQQVVHGLIPNLKRAFEDLPAKDFPKLEEVARETFSFGQGKRALREFNALVAARIRGFELKINPDIRVCFERAGFDAAKYAETLVLLSEDGTRPFLTFGTENLISAMNIGLEAGLRNDDFLRFVRKTIPNLHAQKSIGVSEEGILTLLRAGIPFGTNRWSSPDAVLGRKQHLMEKPLCDTEVMPGFLEYCDYGMPEVCRLIQYFDESTVLSAIEQYQNVRETQIARVQPDPLGDQCQLWNYLVHSLPALKRAYPHPKELKIFSLEHEQMLEALSASAQLDLGAGVATYLQSKSYTRFSSHDSRFHTLSDDTYGLLNFAPEEHHALVTELAFALESLPHKDSISNLKQILGVVDREFERSPEDAEGLIRDALLPALRGGLVTELDELRSLIEEIGVLRQEVDLLPVLRYGFSHLCERRVFSSFDDSVVALKQISNYGNLSVDFWLDYQDLVNQGEVLQDDYWTKDSEIPVLLFSPLSTHPEGFAAFDNNYFTTSRDGIRAFCQYLGTRDPLQFTFLTTLKGASSKLVNRALESRTLLVRNKQWSLPSSESAADFVDQIEREACAYATRLLPLTPVEQQSLLDEPGFRGQRLRAIIASVSLHNYSVAEEQDGRAVVQASTLLKEMTKAHLHGRWRSWRYDSKSAKKQLAVLDNQQQEIWRRNTIDTVLFIPDEEQDHNESLIERLDHLGEHVVNKLRSLYPAFELSQSCLDKLEERMFEKKRDTAGSASERKAYAKLERIHLIAHRLLFLRQNLTSYVSSSQAHSAVRSLHHAFQELKLSRAQEEITSILGAFKKLDMKYLYTVERDDLTAMLDTEDAVKTCIQWSNPHEALSALLHFPSDANVKKVQLTSPKHLFTLSDELPMNLIGEQTQLLMGYRNFNIDSPCRQTGGAWFFTAQSEDDESSLLWRVSLDSSRSRLTFQKREQNGQWDDAFYFLTQSSTKRSRALEVYGPNATPYARMHMRVLETSKGATLFGDPAQPGQRSYEEVLRSALKEKATHMGIHHYSGGRVVAFYPQSRNSHVYSPAVFGESRVPRSRGMMHVRVED